MFIDETWASTKMTRICGRAPRGERLRAAIPHVKAALDKAVEAFGRLDFAFDGAGVEQLNALIPQSSSPARRRLGPQRITIRLMLERRERARLPFSTTRMVCVPLEGTS